MIKHILAATDGSDSACKAVDLAAEISVKFGAELTIIHVLVHGNRAREMERLAESEHIVSQARPALPNISGITGATGELFRVQRSAHETDRIVAAVGEVIAERALQRARQAGAKSATARTVIGEYAEAIVKAAKDAGADMIVLGSRGLGNVKGLLLGSVSHKVIQRANCSVVTVR
jgi:nucleotide-binding universal stress UspA family protein